MSSFSMPTRQNVSSVQTSITIKQIQANYKQTNYIYNQRFHFHFHFFIFTTKTNKQLMIREVIPEEKRLRHLLFAL